MQKRLDDALLDVTAMAERSGHNLKGAGRGLALIKDGVGQPVD